MQLHPLAGYVLLRNVSIGQRILFAIFIAAMALPKQVVLVPLVRIVNFMGIHDTLLGGYLAFNRMAIWGLPHETVQ